MTTTNSPEFPPLESMTLLSHLLLEGCDAAHMERAKDRLKLDVFSLSPRQRNDLLTLAQLNHVVVRGLNIICELARDENDAHTLEWAESALAVENERIENAIRFLAQICAAFEEQNYGVAVIKSLDHWPDLGSDLDLFTDAAPEEVCGLMKRRFDAHIAPRSWGDRLACKWNFMIPGLPEAVEIHVGRLGQTGEQVEIAASVLKRTRLVCAGEYTFRAPSVSERLMISTLQRMYRHFYFRLCDIVDSGALADDGAIDYKDLHNAANQAGIWKGVATYLQIVSDYIGNYRGAGIDVPQFVKAAAQFGGAATYYARAFIRVPIMPQSARLYTSQLAGVIGKGELQNGARLSLLPWLATAAVVGQKLTGSDKGIW